jgi:hypothetical protein
LLVEKAFLKGGRISEWRRTGSDLEEHGGTFRKRRNALYYLADKILFFAI